VQVLGTHWSTRGREHHEWCLASDRQDSRTTFVQGKSTVTTDTYCSDCALELMGYRLTSDFMEVIQSHCLDIESSEGKSCAKCRILIG